MNLNTGRFGNKTTNRCFTVYIVGSCLVNRAYGFWVLFVN